MIFRALCEAHPRRDSGFPSVDERIVFIEADDRETARNRLPMIISTLWGVPLSSLCLANLESQAEIKAQVALVDQPDLPKDFELFVIGFGGTGPRFIRPHITGHPLFLLENSLDRVTEAYKAMLAGQASLEAVGLRETGGESVP